MINKNKFSIKDTKKVLHKVGKRWVVVSAVLLGLAAGGAAVTTQTNVSANTSIGTEETAPANMSSAQIANYKGKIQYYRNKGIMNDTLNGVGDHIKPKMASSADSTAYSNAVNMVRPASLAKLSAGSGEQLGTVTNPSSNTWFSSLSYAEDQAKTFTNNDSKYQKALGILNGELNNTTLPSSVTINSLSTQDLNDIAKGQDYSSIISNKLDSKLGSQYVNNMVDSKLQSLAPALKSLIIPSQFASSVSDPTITRNGNASVNFSVEQNPNVQVSITSPSPTYTFNNPVHVLINNGQPLTVANAINSGIKLTIPSNITVSGLGGNLSINNATIIPKGTVNITISDTVPKLTGGTKKITKYGTLYINESVPKTNTNPLDQPISTKPINIVNNNVTFQKDGLTFNITIPSTISNQTFTSKHSLSTTIHLSDRSYTSQRIADILADTPAVQSDAIDSMISSQIKSHAEALLPTKADSYISDAVNVISAGNEMLKNPNMESVYSNAVDNIANLPNDNESGEYSDLNNAAKNANSLSSGYGTATTSNSRAGSVFTRAANAATSAATSMSNAMSTINTDSTNVNNDVNSIATYSNNLNNDIHLGGKPVSANASTAMSGDYTDVKHDNTIASNAQSAYSDWADTDDAFNVTNANNASTNASTTANNAEKLVNVEFSASVNYMDGSKSVGNSTFSSTISNPSSTLTSAPDVTITNTSNIPAGYKLSNGTSDVITLNGHSYSVNVVSASSNQPTNNSRVTETFYFSGDGSASAVVSGFANSLGSVSAPSGYSFLGGGSLADFTYGTSNSSMTVDVVSASSKPSSASVKPSSSANSKPSSASSSANNMPFIPSFNNGSMANTTSASAEPNSMSTNSNSSSAEPKAHVANYVTVEKALQLHTNPNFTKKNGVAVIEPGTRLDLEKTVRARHGLVRYEVNYKGKNYFVTANKKFTTHLSYELAKPSHYRYFKVGKALQLHTSPYFTKKNGVMTVKPGTEFRINRVVKAHGLVRYEVSYKGSVYFVTANKDFSANAYLQKSNFSKRGHKAVRVIKKLSEYKKASFKKHSLIRNFRKGSVLPVKRVITIANGEMTRLQLTNGRYVTANKDFVRAIR